MLGDSKRESKPELPKTRSAKSMQRREIKGRNATLPWGAAHPHDVGKQSFNVPKNRFRSTFPYDHSRVILKGKGTRPGADYINANYIDSTSNERAYIAAQGPKKSTTDDFWLMIWQEDCRTIVMLANLYEEGKEKCFQYWPDMGHPTKFSRFEISLLAERQFASSITREMTVKNKSNGQERQVKHFHFTKWPDHGTPDAFELIMFQQHIQRSRSSNGGPMIVHCSAGIGRTGTLIGLDALLAAGKTQKRIDIRGYVEIMRKDRMNMIQTVHQYKVLHLALSEGLSSPVSLLSKTTFLGIEQGDPKTVPANQTKIQKEFQVLQNMNAISQNLLKYKCAKSEENTKKNRSMEILAADQYRQLLYSSIPGRTDYINAIKLSSFRCHNKYVITQFPLKDTVVDFWSLVMDTGSNTIVCLGDPVNIRKEQYLWPNKRNMVEVEPYQIKCVSEEKEEYNNVSSLTLELKNEQNGSRRQLKLFSVKGWKDDEVVPTNQNVLCKLHYLAEDWLQHFEEGGPIVIMCLDGAKHCGLYCLISTTIERLDMVSEIDIFAAARQLQLRRPQFIDNVEQYHYAYTTISTLLQIAENAYISQDEAVYENN